jgi:hypothetical protein
MVKIPNENWTIMLCSVVINFIAHGIINTFNRPVTKLLSFEIPLLVIVQLKQHRNLVQQFQELVLCVEWYRLYQLQ